MDTRYFSLKIVALLVVALIMPLIAWAIPKEIDIYADTWVAIDGLDRVLPTAENYPLRTDKERTVGIFYVSWHNDEFYSSFKSPYSSDVTKILQQDPSARLDYNHELWPHEFAYHWGEPELGYFTSGDNYVIRKDLSMLADAGVDVIILDMTNGTLYNDAWEKLFATMSHMRSQGCKVPKFCFWAYNNGAKTAAECIEYVYQRYYKPGIYKSLWFYWNDKPLILYNENQDYSDEINQFFTMRHMWWGYYENNGCRYIGSEDHWSFGYDMHDQRVSTLTPEERASKHDGRNEQMCVTPAQHASTMVGRSWTIAGGEPELDEYDLPVPIVYEGKTYDDPQYLGIYFRDRWNEAISVDPDFIYINDWNEWISGQFKMHEGIDFMGRSNSNFQFVDQYNAEFNRSIQPMKDGGTDNYYMQMIDGIRRYKGVREAPIAYKAAPVSISSEPVEWQAVAECFYDTPGDVTHRNYTGYGGEIYKNNSGRNDILVSKVNVGDGKATFYVETAEELTPNSDPNWMLLFLNSDCDFHTGWEGFDYMVNKEFTSSEHTAIMKWDDMSRQWVTAGIAEFRADGRYLFIEMPLEAVDIAGGDKGNFYFKWADNPASLENAISLCMDGDTAPNRRFCYNYRWNYTCETSVGQLSANDMLKATPLSDRKIHVECEDSFNVVSLKGELLASGKGDSIITVPSPGTYIVSSGCKSVKIIIQ